MAQRGLKSISIYPEQNVGDALVSGCCEDTSRLDFCIKSAIDRNPPALLPPSDIFPSRRRE